MSPKPLERLSALQGSWQAIYQLRGDPSFEHDSPSHATIVPVLGGRFVRIDYTWSDRAAAQEGSLLLGVDGETVTAVWVDSWHNGPRIMVCAGAMAADGGVDVRVSYSAGPGSPDWAWRTQIAVHADAWTMTMLNVTPEGEESLAVRAEYGRS